MRGFSSHLLLTTLLLLPGCHRAKLEGDTRRTENDLKAIHLMYLAYETAHKKPPEKAEDLASIKDQNATPYADAYDRLQKGDYVLAWKTPQDADSRAKSADRLLAYAASAQAHGTHVVLMGDGSIRRVDAASFAELKK